MYYTDGGTYSRVMKASYDGTNMVTLQHPEAGIISGLAADR